MRDEFTKLQFSLKFDSWTEFWLTPVYVLLYLVAAAIILPIFAGAFILLVIAVVVGLIIYPFRLIWRRFA